MTAVIIAEIASYASKPGRKSDPKTLAAVELVSQYFELMVIIIIIPCKFFWNNTCIRACSTLVQDYRRVAGEEHRGDPKSMSGIELDAAIKFVYVAKPEQPTARTGIKGKAAQANFLSNMVPSWTSLLADARLACAAAATAASTALTEAEAAKTTAIADNQPPAPPSVAPGAVTAAGVDVTSMSEAEKRALLAKLTSSLPS